MLVTVAGSCDEVVEVIGRLWPKMTMVSVISFYSMYTIHMNDGISWFGTVNLIDVWSVFNVGPSSVWFGALLSARWPQLLGLRHETCFNRIVRV